jgi:hypothetical protein
MEYILRLNPPTSKECVFHSTLSIKWQTLMEVTKSHLLNINGQQFIIIINILLLEKFYLYCTLKEGKSLISWME